MNFKKKVSGSWVDAPYYLKGTDTETIKMLPATIYPLAQTAALGMKGQTVQNGTPTPDNPIPVIGVGDDNNGQYKIPISSANTTTPIYLGEVETTRLVKKYEFTGNETWSATTDSVYIDKTNFSGEPALRNTPLYCSHYPNDNTGMVMGISWWFRCYDTNSIQNWKNYLQQQYANGTPVTVWYVLATEETAVVNEPLMKIGNYADSISNVSIPVTAGADTLSVDTTLQPSEVSVNYKGWHPVTNVHERSGGAWD